MESHNPITQRIDILQGFYDDFRQAEKAKACLWLLEDDEAPLLDEFFNMECSVYGKTPDFFIRFEAPFHRPNTYGQSLLEELAQKAQGYREEMGEDALNWRTADGGRRTAEMGHEPSAAFFFQNLSELGKSLEDFDDYMVAYLTPQDIRSFPELENWLLDALRSELPPNLRFMLRDDARSPLFQRLAAELPEAVKVFQPKLDMPQAMKEVASAAAGANNPGVKFQHHFIDLSQAVGKGDMDKAKVFADRAAEIAVANNWPHLQIAVCFALGAGWMSRKATAEALHEFDQAILLAQMAQRQNDPMAAPLLVNALFYKGAALLGAGNFAEAAPCYRSAAPAAESAADAFKTMEAWRMAGFCHEQTGEHRAAFDCLQKAFAAAEGMDAELRANSTLPDVAKRLLSINEQHIGQASLPAEVEAKMAKWLNG